MHLNAIILCLVIIVQTHEEAHKYFNGENYPNLPEMKRERGSWAPDKRWGETIIKNWKADEIDQIRHVPPDGLLIKAGEDVDVSGFSAIMSAIQPLCP